MQSFFQTLLKYCKNMKKKLKVHFLESLFVDQLIPSTKFDLRGSYIERAFVLLWYDTTPSTEVPVYL